jgi:hypothetical protein
MTNEEQQALVQFFGTVHAQAKQSDQMIVQHAKDLRPVSSDIQNQLQQALIIQQQQEHQRQLQEQQYHPRFHNPTPEQVMPAPAMHYAPEVPPALQQPVEQQLELFNFTDTKENVQMERIIKRLNETTSYLHEIKSQLKVITEILEKNSLQLSVNDKAANKNKIKE